MTFATSGSFGPRIRVSRVRACRASSSASAVRRSARNVRACSWRLHARETPSSLNASRASASEFEGRSSRAALVIRYASAMHQRLVVIHAQAIVEGPAYHGLVVIGSNPGDCTDEHL